MDIIRHRFEENGVMEADYSQKVKNSKASKHAKRDPTNKLDIFIFQVFHNLLCILLGYAGGTSFIIGANLKLSTIRY